MRIGAALSLLLLTLSRFTRGDELGEFRLPDPEELNITVRNLTSGYNPWMPKYTGGDTSKKTFILLSSGCLSGDAGEESFFQGGVNGWREKCNELEMECQCRPLIASKSWNVQLPKDLKIYQGIHFCSWEIRRILGEHKRGLINAGAISAKCSLRNPEIYNEAREVGVPVFLFDENPPRPGDENFGKPEPDGYIGANQEFFGRVMARVLKQLRPEGATYGFVMAWESPGANQRRDGFNAEMASSLVESDDKAVWREVETYPYERPYNLSVPCHHMTCQMEGLISQRDIDAFIYLFQSPLNNPNYTNWVDSYRHRNLTHIGVDAVDLTHYLGTGYLHGLVGQIVYEWGQRSAEILFDVSTKLDNDEITLPLENNFFETKLLSYSVIPLDLNTVNPPDLDENLLNNLVYTCYFFVGIVWTTALFCAGWTIYNKSAIIVRAAQPFFLLIVVFGIVVLSSTIIPLSFDDGGEPDSISETFAVGVCMSQPWLAFTGFSVIFSALFSKTWRVNRLFHNSESHARVQVTAADVLTPFAIIFTCNLIVLTCWTVLDPLTYTRLDGDGTDFWNRQIESYGTCRSDTALAYLIPLAFINFMVLSIACWQAFEARNIKSEFSESRYIGMSVASLLQAFITGLPIVSLVKDEPKAFYLVLTLMIFVLSEGVLLLIFLPKFYLAYRYSGMTRAEQRRSMSQHIRYSASRPSSSFSGRNKAEQGRKFFRAMSPAANTDNRENSEFERSVLGGRDATVCESGGLASVSQGIENSSRGSGPSVTVNRMSDPNCGMSSITNFSTASSHLTSGEFGEMGSAMTPMPTISSESKFKNMGSESHGLPLDGTTESVIPPITEDPEETAESSKGRSSGIRSHDPPADKSDETVVAPVALDADSTADASTPVSIPEESEQS